MISKSNPVIQANSSIGQISAEADDEFLFKCQVNHPATEVLLDPKSSKMVLLGSTGSGKTATLRIIESSEERCESIELDELALNYISNSDVISFLMTLDVHLEHFFQALWKHVICIEYIKLRFNVDSEYKSRHLWGRIKEYFGDKTPKKRALEYLEKWEDKFWVSFDENIKEITQALEREIDANFAAELKKFKTDAGYKTKLSKEKKTHLQQRLRKYVDANLLSDLAQVINLLSEYDVDIQSTNYILIDRLDDDWIQGDIRYHLIRALIESLKSMRRVQDLKVIVALRSDIMERVIQETKELGFQSEKYEDYIVRMSWTTEELKNLINKRINYLFRRKYSKDNVFFENIFIGQIGKENSFKFILERTLLRPRDAITFVNECLVQAQGKPEVRRGDAYQAERVYSENRLDALVDEWRPVYPAIEPIIRLLRGKRSSFPVSELFISDTIDELVSEVYSKESFQRDQITNTLDRATNTGGDNLLWDIVVEIIDRLHISGAIGVTTDPDKPVQWFYKNQRRLSRSSLSIEKKVRIHPMLHVALGVVK